MTSPGFKGVLKTASFTQLSPASPVVVFSKLCSTNSDATYQAPACIGCGSNTQRAVVYILPSHFLALVRQYQFGIAPRPFKDSLRLEPDRTVLDCAARHFSRIGIDAQILYRFAIVHHIISHVSFNQLIAHEVQNNISFTPNLPIPTIKNTTFSHPVMLHFAPKHALKWRGATCCCLHSLMAFGRCH